MSKKIKFRAWDNKKKKFIYDSTYDHCEDMDGKHCKYLNINFNGTLEAQMDDDGGKNGLWEHDVDLEKDRFILMQYTGLKDKNGKEIYEGDDVDVKMSVEGGTLPHRGWIVYDEKFGAFGTKNDAGVTLLHNHCLHTLEIIGNIYENPELLESRNEQD